MPTRRRIRSPGHVRTGDRVRRFLPRRFLGTALGLSGFVLLLIPAGHRAAGLFAQAAALSRPPASEVRAGEALGRIAIPRVRMDVAVFEGTTDAVLRKGPGHLSGTAWPGLTAAGNCVIAGHRDSFFRKLAAVRAGDLVTVNGPSGPRRYALAESRIVSPEDDALLEETPDERLTLVSCYPFRWTGPAPYRIVWIGRPLSASAESKRPTAGGGIPERPAQGAAVGR